MKSPTVSPRYTWNVLPFIGVHVAAVLGVIIVGFEWKWLALTATVYFFGMLGITAGYHRYFSHRSYKTGRVFQFILALLGTFAMQKGVLWWASHHRDHHRFADTDEDMHSPTRQSFWWAHLGWFLSNDHNETRWERIVDMAVYPELLWLDRYYLVPPVLLGVLVFVFGGLPALVWGSLVATVLLWHATFSINSFMHLVGTRRFATKDDSRNSLFFALITLGEGWHNNHHFYRCTANQGFFWWEIDITFYVLKLCSWLGLVSDLRKPPNWVLEKAAAPPVLENHA